MCAATGRKLIPGVDNNNSTGYAKEYRGRRIVDLTDVTGGRDMAKGWDNAKAFISWLNEQTHGKFRLPTEAEWEYAARAGTTTDYPWGQSFDGQANLTYDSDKNPLHPLEKPVGSYPPNSWGLYDVMGAW